MSTNVDEHVIAEDPDLVGSLFPVPDKWWGFEAVGRENHPGAVVGFSKNGFQVAMLKGTDPNSARFHDVSIVIHHDESNGLKKPTAFAIKPRLFSARRVMLLEDRRIGRLADEDLQRLRSELVRLFGQGDTPHA